MEKTIFDKLYIIIPTFFQNKAERHTYKRMSGLAKIMILFKKKDDFTYLFCLNKLFYLNQIYRLPFCNGKSQ